MMINTSQIAAAAIEPVAISNSPDEAIGLGFSDVLADTLGGVGTASRGEKPIESRSTDKENESGSAHADVSQQYLAFTMGFPMPNPQTPQPTPTAGGEAGESAPEVDSVRANGSRTDTYAPSVPSVSASSSESARIFSLVASVREAISSGQVGIDVAMTTPEVPAASVTPTVGSETAQVNASPEPVINSNQAIQAQPAPEPMSVAQQASVPNTQTAEVSSTNAAEAPAAASPVSSEAPVVSRPAPWSPQTARNEMNLSASMPKPRPIREALGQIIQRLKERIDIHWGPRPRSASAEETAAVAEAFPQGSVQPEQTPASEMPTPSPVSEVATAPMADASAQMTSFSVPAEPETGVEESPTPVVAQGTAPAETPAEPSPAANAAQAPVDEPQVVATAPVSPNAAAQPVADVKSAHAPGAPEMTIPDEAPVAQAAVAAPRESAPAQQASATVTANAEPPIEQPLDNPPVEMASSVAVSDTEQASTNTPSEQAVSIPMSETRKAAAPVTSANSAPAPQEPVASQPAPESAQSPQASQVELPQAEVTPVSAHAEPQAAPVANSSQTETTHSVEQTAQADDGMQPPVSEASYQIISEPIAQPPIEEAPVTAPSVAEDPELVVAEAPRATAEQPVQNAQSQPIAPQPESRPVADTSVAGSAPIADSTPIIEQPSVSAPAMEEAQAADRAPNMEAKADMAPVSPQATASDAKDAVSEPMLVQSEPMKQEIAANETPASSESPAPNEPVASQTAIEKPNEAKPERAESAALETAVTAQSEIPADPIPSTDSMPTSGTEPLGNSSSATDSSHGSDGPSVAPIAQGTESEPTEAPKATSSSQKKTASETGPNLTEAIDSPPDEMPIKPKQSADPTPKSELQAAMGAAMMQAKPVTEPVAEAAKPHDIEVSGAEAIPTVSSHAAPKAHVSEAAPVREATQVPPKEFVDQVVRALRVEVGEGRSEMTLRMDPPSLGHLHVKLTTDSGVLSAGIHAESEGTRSLLEAHLPALRTALADAGIQVQHFTVSTGSDSSQFGQQAPNHQPAPRHGGNAPSSGTSSKETAPSAAPEGQPSGAVDYFA